MSKFKKVARVFAVILLLAGIGVLLYPHITQMIYDKGVEETVAVFEADVGEPGTNPLLEELYRKMQAENKRMFEDGQKDLSDPFAYQQPGMDISEYGISENIVGYLTIPVMGETLPICLGASEENMTKGAVHLTETSYPIGGKNTNSVLAAHRGYYKASMFRYIDKLSLGDSVIVRNFRETLHYKVVGMEVILPNEIDKVLIQEGRDMITLFSCHPYGQNTYRYVVYCERDET